MLALAGGVFGLAVAHFSTIALVALAPPDIPRLDEVELNLSVLFFSLAVTMGTALLAGLLPAVRASQVSRSLALSNRTTEPGAERGGLRWRNGFVVTQLGTSVVLVVATALLARSVSELQRVELGFEPSRALAGDLRLTSAHHPGVEARIAFYRQVIERLSAVPGVTAAAVVSGVPLGGLDSIEVTPAGSVDAFDSVYRVTTPGLIETLGLSLLEGRDLTWTDLARTDHLMTLVDASFAESAWPGESAIGRRFKITVLRLSDDRDIWEGLDEAEVVGVIADMPGRDPRESDPPTFFISQRLRATSGQKIVLRTEADPLALTEPLRSTIADLDATIPVARVWRVEDSVAEATRSVRFVASLFSALGIVGLVLAAVGLYSVMTYTVASRRAEFGIRFALGATGRVIGGLVLGAAFRLTALGIASGTLAAMVLARFLEAQLFGVSAHDVRTYVGVAVTLCLVAVGAAILPALRAWHDDPIDSLRGD